MLAEVQLTRISLMNLCQNGATSWKQMTSACCEMSFTSAVSVCSKVDLRDPANIWSVLAPMLYVATRRATSPRVAARVNVHVSRKATATSPRVAAGVRGCWPRSN